MIPLLSTVQRLYKEASHTTLVEEVRDGYLSRNFILDNRGEKFFLKQYRFDSVEKIAEIHRAKFFFARGGIPVILPLKTLNGEYFFEEAGKFYALFPFVDGRIIPRAERSPHAIESAARMLAKIHLLSKDGFSVIVQDEAKEWDKEKSLEESSRIQEKIDALNTKSDFDYLALHVLEYKRKIVEANTTQYRELGLINDHLIHGDYHGNNIFYDEHDEVRYVFDLEKTKRSPRILEVVRCIDYMCFSGHYDEKRFHDACIFLAAYSGQYSIERDELARGLHAYFLKNSHSLWIEREHYINNNTRVDCFLEQELRFLTYCSKHLDLLTRRLVKALQ